MKIKKLPQQNYERVRHLFHDAYPNLPTAYGVIEGFIPAQIWVDDEMNPNACIIICEDPYCIVAGEIDKNIFQDFLIPLKSKKSIKMQCEPSAHYKNFDLSEFGFTPILRREYKYKSNSLNIPKFANETGFIIKKIENEQIFDLCLWKSIMLDIYGSASNYLQNTMGYLLWDANQELVVSEAHGIRSKEWIEIATVTHEKYRGKKLSTIVCNHLIHEGIKQGLRPVWSSDENNIASWKAAEHQGMDVMTQYIFYSNT